MKNLMFAIFTLVSFKGQAAENAMEPYQGTYRVKSCTIGRKAKPCDVKFIQLYLIYDMLEINPRYIWGSRPVAMKKDPRNDFRYTNYHSSAVFTPQADGSLSLKIYDYIPSSYELIKD